MSGHKHEQASKQHQHAPSSPSPLRFTPGSPVGAPRAEWLPLEGSIQFWAEIAREVTRPRSLYAVGAAFLAFSFESSAHESYTHGWHSLYRTNPDVVARDIAQTLSDLCEAEEHWQMLLHQLETFGKEEGLTSEQRQAIYGQITTHLHRAQLLRQSVRTEQRRTKQLRFVQEIPVRNTPPVPPILSEGGEVPTIGEEDNSSSQEQGGSV